MISVIVPAYNEEENISNCVYEINEVMISIKDDWELIVVDDGSKDKTLLKLDELKTKFKNLVILSNGKNIGPGAAFRNGFRAAKGDKIITIDSDLSYSPEKIPSLLDYVGDYDVVIGSWNKGNAKLINVPQSRVLVSKVAHFLDKNILRVNLSSLSSFFVAYKSDVINNITFESDGFDAQCEIITKIYRKGHKIKEVPVDLAWGKCRRSNSKLKLMKEIKNRFALWKRLRKI
jgi:glycosyltransferase involved in cell wall biosynthesis